MPGWEGGARAAPPATFQARESCADPDGGLGAMLSFVNDRASLAAERQDVSQTHRVRVVLTRTLAVLAWTVVMALMLGCGRSGVGV